MKKIINFNIRVVLIAFLLITATANLFSQTEGVEKNSGDTLDKKKPSFNAYKNSVQLDIGGAANIIKISYSRNFYLNNKLIIAPRIGFSTIGVDFKALGKKRCEFVIGFRFLFIAVVPIGLPIQHQKSFYNRYEGKYETTSFLPSATATNYVGINYHFKSFFINGNVAIHSLVVDRDDKFGNDLFSSGIGFGYKF